MTSWPTGQSRATLPAKPEDLRSEPWQQTRQRGPHPRNLAAFARNWDGMAERDLYQQALKIMNPTSANPSLRRRGVHRQPSGPQRGEPRAMENRRRVLPEERGRASRTSRWRSFCRFERTGTARVAPMPTSNAGSIGCCRSVRNAAIRRRRQRRVAAQRQSGRPAMPAEQIISRAIPTIQSTKLLVESDLNRPAYGLPPW